MPSSRTRKIVVTGVLGAIAIILGLTRIGFIPWFSGASLTIMHVPVIIGAVLEGPIVGVTIGLIFGIFSMIQAAVAPNGPTDIWFTNPLLSVMPRLFIGPLAWVVWNALKRWPVAQLRASIIPEGYKIHFVFQLKDAPAVGLISAGIIGSLTNTILVLGMIGVLGFLPWATLPAIALANGIPEAAASALITLLVVAAWQRIEIGRKKGADL